MRALNTIACLPKHTRQLTAILVMPLLLSVWMSNLTTTSHAEDGMEVPTLTLEIIHFDAFSDPIENYVELSGQIQSENPEGLTITFTGVVNGTVQTDSSGSFNYLHIEQGGVDGEVHADVSQGTETASKSLNI